MFVLFVFRIFHSRLFSFVLESIKIRLIKFDCTFDHSASESYFLSKPVKWELEINVIIEDGEWETICSGCHKGINSNL